MLTDCLSGFLIRRFKRLTDAARPSKLSLSLVRLRIAKVNDMASQYCRARPDEGAGPSMTNKRPVMTEYRFIAHFSMGLNLTSPHLQNPSIYARFVGIEPIFEGNASGFFLDFFLDEFPCSRKLLADQTIPIRVDSQPHIGRLITTIARQR
jgi:hypothetical protein